MDVWKREHAYLGQENDNRYDWQTTTAAFAPAGDIPTSPEAIRVLVVGDSFVAGLGLFDPDARWWVQLQDELDARTAAGAFTVKAIAVPGASTTLESTWLHSDLVQQYNPDVVIVGYVFNDPIPHDIEFKNEGPCARSCPPIIDRQPEYHECAKTHPLDQCAETLKAQFPNGIIESSAVNDPLGNPYSDLFTKAIADIGNTVTNATLIWLPTPTIPGEWDLSQVVRPLFAQAGFITVDPVSSLALLVPLAEEDAAIPDLHVHPLDRHPGPILTRAYAQDAAKAVLQALPSSQVTAAVHYAQEHPVQPSALVTWQLPTSLEVQSDATQAQVRMTSTAPDPETEADGQQMAPCASLNRPHARLVLSRLLPPNTPLNVTLTQGSTSTLDVYAFGYTPHGASTITFLGALRSGQELTTRSGPLTRGLLLAPPGPAGCPATDSFALPPFTVDISVQSP